MWPISLWRGLLIFCLLSCELAPGSFLPSSSSFFSFFSPKKDSLQLVEAQSCEVYRNGTGFGYCDKWVDYRFFLPFGPTKWMSEVLVYHTAYLLTTSATIFGKSCAGRLEPLFCSSLFPRCTIDNTTGVARAQPPCSSLCFEADVECGESPSGFWQPLNCTALGVSQDEDVCYRPRDTSNLGPGYPFECGRGMVNNDGVCELFCPADFTNVDGETLREISRWLLRILLPPGFFLILSMILMCLYRWRYWVVWPKIYIFYILLATFMFDFAFMMGVMVGGQDHLGCTEHHTAIDQTVTAQVQSWFSYPWGLVLNACFPSLALCLLLTFTYPTWTRKYYRVVNVLLHCFIFGVPFVSIIVIQAVGLNGRCDGSFPCSWINKPVGSLEFGLSFFVSVLPVTVHFVLGWLVAVPLLFLRVYRVSGWAGVAKQKRLLAFCILYGFTTPLNVASLYQLFFGGSRETATNYYAAVFFNKFQRQLYGHAEPPPPYPLVEENYYRLDPFSFLWYTSISPIYASYLYVVFFFAEAFRVAFKKGKGTNVSTAITGSKPKRSGSKSKSKSKSGSSQQSQDKEVSRTSTNNDNND